MWATTTFSFLFHKQSQTIWNDFSFHSWFRVNSNESIHVTKKLLTVFTSVCLLVDEESLLYPRKTHALSDGISAE